MPAGLVAMSFLKCHPVIPPLRGVRGVFLRTTMLFKFIFTAIALFNVDFNLIMILGDTPSRAYVSS
jgi:hypothetical protein